MVYSDSCKLIFYPIPRTGSLTVRKILFNQCKAKYFRGTHSRYTPKRRKDYFKFTLVRNPLKRLVSLWWHMRTEGASEFNFLRDLSFEDFSKWLVTEGQFSSEVFCNQRDYLDGLPYGIDIVIKLEELNTIFDKVSCLVQEPVEITHKSEYENLWYSYYDESIKKLTFPYIEPDLTKFGYEFTFA